MRINPKPKQILRTERSTAFVDGPGGNRLKGIMRNVYEPDPLQRGHKLRAARFARELSLRGASTELRITPVQLSALEQEEMTLTDEEWVFVFATLEERP